MVVRELLTNLGFNADTAEAQKYDKVFGGIVKTAAAVGAATAAAGGIFLKMAGDMEQTEIAMRTMIGSAEEADTLLRDITEFASKTPFQLTGLIESSKQLLAFGFESEEVIGTMQSLGNIAAGVGKDKMPTLVRSLGKIRTKGKAGMEELNMMLEAGVPILDALSEKFGVTSEELFKMSSRGEIGFEDVNQALKNMSSGSGMFAGLMEKQSRSFLGIISNIKDVIEVTAIEIGQELLPVASEIAGVIKDWLTQNKEMIKQGLVEWFRKLAFAIVWVVLFIKTLADMFGGFGNILDWILPILQVAVPAFLAIVGALKLWAIAQAIVNAVMAANPISLIIIGIIALIAIIHTLWKNSETFRTVVTAVFNGVKAVIFGAWNWLRWIGGKIAGFASIVWDAVKDIAGSLWDVLDNKALQAFILGFAPLIGIPIIIAKHWDKVKAVIDSIIAGIKEIFALQEEGQEQRDESFRKDQFQEDVAAAKDQDRNIFSRMFSSLKASFGGQSTVTPGMAGAPTISTMNGSQNSTNNVEINVNAPGGNADDIGRAVRGELDRALRGAQADGGGSTR